MILTDTTPLIYLLFKYRMNFSVKKYQIQMWYMKNILIPLCKVPYLMTILLISIIFPWTTLIQLGFTMILNEIMGSGELYNNPAVENIFQKFDYQMLLASPDVSFQNAKFWTYAISISSSSVMFYLDKEILILFSSYLLGRKIFLTIWESVGKLHGYALLEFSNNVTKMISEAVYS